MTRTGKSMSNADHERKHTHEFMKDEMEQGSTRISANSVNLIQAGYAAHWPLWTLTKVPYFHWCKSEKIQLSCFLDTLTNQYLRKF